MDFHALLAKMQELDQAPADQPAAEACGDPVPSMASPSMPPVSQETPPPPHPSMSVNINAQGIDNIKDMMSLWMKVNPDMMPKDPVPMPSMSMEPSITAIKPVELPPLKMLPDFDADNDKKVGGEIDIKPISKSDSPLMKMDLDSDKGSQPGGLGASLDRDGDGDHDMDDHDIEPKDDNSEKDDEKKEAWDNEPDTCEDDIDYMNNKLAGGMNKPKATFPKVADADNPMQKISKMGEDDLRSKIRAELLQRLAESENKNLNEGPMDLIKKAGSAVKGAVTGAVAGAKKAVAAPAASGAGVSPQQAAKAAPPAKGATANVKSAAPAAAPTATELNPLVKENLPQGLRQIADGVEEGNFKSVQDIMKEIKFLADELVKQSTGAK